MRRQVKQENSHALLPSTHAPGIGAAQKARHAAAIVDPPAGRVIPGRLVRSQCLVIHWVVKGFLFCFVVYLRGGVWFCWVVFKKDMVSDTSRLLQVTGA